MDSEKVKNTLFRQIFFDKNYQSEVCWRNTLPPTGNKVTSVTPYHKLNYTEV